MRHLNAGAIDDILGRMAGEIAEVIAARGLEPALVGIHTGGYWIAERLLTHLGASSGLHGPVGGLNISFYRDDFARIGVHPQVKPSRLPFSVDERHVVLVDDVLYTGRTVRAAMNELFDYGRPGAVSLAVLVSRDGRELPICPDVVGTHLSLGGQEHIKLSGPEPLELHVMKRPAR